MEQNLLSDLLISYAISFITILFSFYFKVLYLNVFSLKGFYLKAYNA